MGNSVKHLKPQYFFFQRHGADESIRDVECADGLAREAYGGRETAFCRIMNFFGKNHLLWFESKAKFFKECRSQGLPNLGRPALASRVFSSGSFTIKLKEKKKRGDNSPTQGGANKEEEKIVRESEKLASKDTSEKLALKDTAAALQHVLRNADFQTGDMEGGEGRPFILKKKTLQILRCSCGPE
ncbi:hypothetical protein ACLOJK_005131 [Asimina triloba]